MGNHALFVDPFGRCSDPAYFTAVNLLQPHHNQTKVPIYYTADNLPNPLHNAVQCWSRGRTTAENIAKDLSGQLPVSANGNQT